MVWFYQRGGESLRLETRYEDGLYVLVSSRADDSEHIERFDNQETFRVRLAALEQELQDTRWAAIGPPMLLKDGWRLT
jgi:hypothetical protein